MALTEEERTSMRAITFDAATALRDDIEFMREVLAKTKPNRSDVRRLSVLLRRLLLEGELAEVASPRIGSVRIDIVDLNPLRSFVEESQLKYAILSLPKIFNVEMRAMGGPIPSWASGELVKLQEQADSMPLKARVSRFMNEQVAYFDSKWISRSDFLKYVAYKMGGVHFKGDDRRNFDLIKKCKYFVVLAPSQFPGIDADIRINTPGVPRTPTAKHSDRQGIELPLLQLFSVARYLVDSEDVTRLLALIEHEEDPGD